MLLVNQEKTPLFSYHEMFYGSGGAGQKLIYNISNPTFMSTKPLLSVMLEISDLKDQALIDQKKS